MNETSVNVQVSIEPNSEQTVSQSLPTKKSQDGVFSNLNAKPEIIKIEQLGEYMDKPPSYSQAALNMPPTYQDALDDFNVIEGMLVGNIIGVYYYTGINFVDDFEVGSGGLFLAHCLGSIVFHFLGVILGLLLSKSYAGRYGTISGAGILLILYSLTIEDDRTINPEIRSSLAIFLFITGYLIFMSSLFMYQRVVERAKEIFRNNYI